MPHTLERIEIAGPDAKARRLVFSDSETTRLTSASVVRALALAPGQECTLDELEIRLTETEEEQIRERALRLLSHRERTSSELRKRLRDDGYPGALADALVDRYLELGLVDDTRFASMFARTRAGAGYGDRRVRDELRRKGVPDDVIAEALTETSRDDEVELARAALRGRSPKDRKDRERLIRRLVTRGFSFSAAIAAVGKPDEMPGDE